MSALTRDLLPASASLPTDRQRLFVLFFTGTLIDLVVLGLFAEHARKVFVDTFTTALLAAIVLQALLKITIITQRRIIAGFKTRTGAKWTVLKHLSVWMVFFGSKFLILEILSFAFGDSIRIEGKYHGFFWMTLVVLSMIAAEETIVRFYRNWLGDPASAASIIPAVSLRSSSE